MVPMTLYSGNIRLRLPADLHARLADIADGVGVSLNTLMVTLLAEGATRRANEERAAPANVAEAMAEAVLDSLSKPTRSGQLIDQLDSSAPEWRLWIPPYRLAGQAGDAPTKSRKKPKGANMDANRAIANKVVSDLAAGHFDAVEEVVKGDARKVLNAGAFESLWTQVEDNSGDFQGSGEPLVSPVSGGHLYDYPVTFGDDSNHLQVVVIDGEVAGMILRPGNPTGQWNT